MNYIDFTMVWTGRRGERAAEGTLERGETGLFLWGTSSVRGDIFRISDKINKDINDISVG